MTCCSPLVTMDAWHLNLHVEYSWNNHKDNCCLADEQLVGRIWTALKFTPVVGIGERTAQPTILKIDTNVYVGLLQKQSRCGVRLVMLGFIDHQLSNQIQWVFLSMVKRRACFIVLISEITRCIYKVALPNWRDNLGGRYESLKTEQVAKKHECQGGSRRWSSDSTWQIKLQKIREEAYITIALLKRRLEK